MTPVLPTQLPAGCGLRPARQPNLLVVDIGRVGDPVAGALTVALGTVAAVVTAPIDLEEPGAVRVTALILAVSLCLVPFLKAIRRPNALLRAEHVLVMSPVFWLLLDPIQGSYDLAGLPPFAVQRAFLTIGVFSAAAWLAQRGRVWTLPKFFREAAAREITSNTLFTIGLVASGLAFCRFAIPAGFDLRVMINALGAGRWDAPWARRQLGGTDAFLDHLSYFGYIVPSLAVLLARQLGWRDLKPVIVLGLSVVLSLFLSQGGNRRIVGVVFGSAAVVWYLSAEHANWRKLGVLALGLAGLMSILNMMLDYRNIGFRAVLDPEFREEVVGGTLEDEALIRIDDNFIRLAEMNLIFPTLEPYTTWRYPLWVVSRPLPRVLWPAKPLDPGFDLSEFLGIKGVSLSCSVIGELTMAGGLFAVALGGYLYGRLAQSLSHLLTTTGRSGLLVYAIGTLALFAGMRSMIELVLMSYGILAWAALVWLLGSRTGTD